MKTKITRSDSPLSEFFAGFRNSAADPVHFDVCGQIRRTSGPHRVHHVVAGKTRLRAKHTRTSRHPRSSNTNFTVCKRRKNGRRPRDRVSY